MALVLELFSAFFWSFSVELLPYVIAFVLASHANLRLWLAVQKAPLPDSQDEDSSQQESTIVRIFVRVAFLSLAVLLIVALALVENANVKLAALVSIVVFSFVLFVASVKITCLFLGDIFQIDTRSVHRLANGGFIAKRIPREPGQKKRMLAKLGTVFLAIVINLGAIGEHCYFFIAVASVALSYFMTCKSLLARISVRGLVYCYLVIAAFVVAFDSAAIWYLIKHVPQNPVQIPNRNALFELLTKSIWVQGPILSIFPGMLIALALRFDYQRHLDSSDIPDNFILSTIMPTVPEHGQGVVVPSKIPTGFSKVYYATAMATWAILHTACIIAGHLVELNFMYLASAAGFLVEVPIIIAFLVIIAIRRGEVQTLWNYREDWRLKLGQIRLTEA